MSEENQSTSVQPESIPFENKEQKEKLIPQSQVDHIVGHTRKESYERAMREFERNRPASLSEEEINKKISERAEKEAREHFERFKEKENNERNSKKAEEEASKIISSLDEARKLNPELSEDIKSIDWDLMAPLIPHMNKFGNSADILIDLSRNPEKVPALLALVNFQSNSSLNKILDKLSGSLKRNKDAKDIRFPKDPLPSLSSSPRVEQKEVDKLTVSDFRNMFRRKNNI